MKKHVSIWFIIGLQVALFGILILGAGIYGLFHSPSVHTVLEEVHAGIYWGAFMTALGLFYIFKFRPR
jgi:hypothetical protein